MKQKFSNFDEWTLVARTGNYLVKMYSDDELRYFAVKPAAGMFAVVYRNDHPMHLVIQSFLDDQITANVLDTLIHMQVMMSNIIPDAQFVAEFSQIYTECVMRNTGAAVEMVGSEEEILNEDVVEAEMSERMEEMDDLPVSE